ncbi:MAG: hypothetical protein QM765_51755 [Myxococcales bacterium]
MSAPKATMPHFNSSSFCLRVGTRSTTATNPSSAPAGSQPSTRSTSSTVQAWTKPLRERSTMTVSGCAPTLTSARTCGPSCSQ